MPFEGPKTTSQMNVLHLEVMTGRYIGELDGTTKLEWVKVRL